MHFNHLGKEANQMWQGGWDFSSLLYVLVLPSLPRFLPLGLSTVTSGDVSLYAPPYCPEKGRKTEI